MTTIPVREGIILGAEDETPSKFTAPRRPMGHAHIKVYRGRWWLPIALGIGIPVLFLFGVFIMALFMTLGAAIWIIRRAIGPRRG